ncbi:MAG: hypothetical protein H0T44_01080 [Gemmatimonadales bacterium]|nr:hypothetical protein [Gemmatimonadales bacterium]
MPRPTPFDLVFEQIAEEQFPGIQSALAEKGYQATDRDAFLMVREVVMLVRELRPEQGLGEGVDQLVALIHHAYLIWEAGMLTLSLGHEQAAELLEASAPATVKTAELPRAYYAQLPERRIWAEVVEGEPAEPLDGCFVHTTFGGELRVLGVFGLHPGRSGFSVVEAVGSRPGRLVRLDGTPLFAPALSGGAAARLNSIVGGEELLELGWRTRFAAAAASLEAVRWTP